MTENRWISDLHWRREGQQTRSEKTQSALLDATEALIVEKGTRDASINDIAKRAGCSVGTLYHHFKDKEALFYALFDRMTKAYEATLDQAADEKRWEGASVRDLFSGYIDLMLQGAKEQGRGKAAIALVTADHPELRQHMAELTAASRKALLTLVLARQEQIGHPRSENAAAFMIDQLGAMLRARFDPGQKISALVQSDDATFKQELLTITERFLELKTE